MVDHTDPTKLIIPALEVLKDGPYIVVATTGGSQTAELRQRFAGPNIVIDDFIDCDVLFQHVDVFVMNDGFGSVLTATRHGVPVVAAGKTEGKNDSNARIGHNRLGVDLRKERPKPASIHAAVVRFSRTRPTPPTSAPYARNSMVRPDGPYRSSAHGQSTAHPPMTGTSQINGSACAALGLDAMTPRPFMPRSAGGVRRDVGPASGFRASRH